MELQPGPIDIHCHVIPDGCFTIPSADGDFEIAARDDGELFWGDVPLAIKHDSLSDVNVILDDMDRSGIAVRALSPPPFSYVFGGSVDAAVSYARKINDAVVAMCQTAPTRLLALLTVPLVDTDVALDELRRIRELPGVRGITLPPLIGNGSMNDEPLRTVVTEASRAGLSIVVHPMAGPGPGLGHHYLINLIGNPVESTAAIGAIILSGMADALPDLRMAFFHGGGCAPYILSRWDHAWRVREDVSSDTDRLPSEIFRDRLYIDTLTHGEPQARYLETIAGRDKLCIGSDYPFDMASADPVGAARDAGLDIDLLTANARKFLGF